MSEVAVYYDAGEDSAAEDGAGAASSPGLGEVTRRLREAGVEYRVVDAGELSREEREAAYHSLAVRPSVRRRYRVRRVFGTHKYPGSFFGSGVPALVVIEDGRPVDVYPHEEQDGTIVTIEDYLRSLDGSDDTDEAAETAGRAALLRRMDALRSSIGAVGVSSRELIEEGRVR